MYWNFRVVQGRVNGILKKCRLPLPWWKAFCLLVLIGDPHKEFEELKKEVWKVIEENEMLEGRRTQIFENASWYRNRIHELEMRHTEADKLYDAQEVIARLEERAKRSEQNTDTT